MFRVLQRNLSIASLLLIFVVFIAYQASRAEDSLVVGISEISISKKNGNRVYLGKAFTGKAVSYFPNGELATAEQFKNGRRHGFVKHWFSSGKLGFESRYRMGRRQGTTTSWWSNGNMRSQTEYLDDKAEGVAWQWYSTGEKLKKFNYVAGRPSGIQQAWRTNGKLFSNFEFKNGRIYGLKKANLCVGLEDEKILLN